jgi:hypothetical protein
MLLFIANSKLLKQSSAASVSQPSDTAFITTHLSRIFFSLATESTANASISTISAQCFSLNSHTTFGSSIKVSQLKQTQLNINPNFVKS